MSREYAEPAFAELHGSMNHLIEQLIDYAQQDIRRLIFILQDIKYAYGNKTITDKLLTEYQDITKNKHDPEKLIKYEECLEKLFISKLKCYFLFFNF